SCAGWRSRPQHQKPTLIHLKPVCLDWSRPARDFIDDKLCKVFRRSALGRNTRNPEFMQALLNRWRVDGLARCIVELLDDRCGRSCRKEKCVPGHDVEVGKSLLVRGCQIRHERRSITRQRRNRLYLLSHDQGTRTADIEAHIIDLPPDQIIRGRATSSIRYMRDVYADNRIEQRAAKVRRSTGSS